jgi:hypothetical protein
MGLTREGHTSSLGFGPGCWVKAARCMIGSVARSGRAVAIRRESIYGYRLEEQLS